MTKSFTNLRSLVVLVLALALAPVDASAQPDLSLESMSVQGINVGYTYQPGDKVVMSFWVRNIGNQHSDSYSLDFYAYSSYEYIGIGSSNSFEGLSPGEQDLQGAWCYLPGDIPPGDYSVHGVLNCSNDVDTTNNTGDYSSITVIGPDPQNLQIQSVDTVDGIYQPGDPIIVSVSIQNLGGASTDNYTIDYYVSTDTVITVDDHKIKSLSHASLMMPDEYDSFDTTCQLPADISLGKYYIGIIITYPDGGDSENVAFDSTPIYIGVPADLAIQSVDATNGTYSPCDQIVVQSLIENVGQQTSDNYSIDYYASTDSIITTTDYKIGHTDQSGLSAGEQHNFDTTCQFPLNISMGNYYIGVIVACSNDIDAENDVMYDGGTIRIILPLDSVSGRLKYQDRDGGEYPIRYALVKICDGNTDQLLEETYTDGNGNYSVRVANDGQSVQDIYVNVYTEGVSGAYPDAMSKICSVRDDIFHEIYYLKSDLYPNPQDASVVINMTAHGDSGEFMVYDSIVEGFEKAWEFFDIELSEVCAYWPCEEDMSYYDPCDWGIYIAQEDRGDRDVVMHEYGHYISQTYHFAQGAVGDSAMHIWNADLRRFPEVNRTDEEARNLAFREAWASLFSIATQYGDTGYPYAGDTKYQDMDEGSGEVFEIDLERDRGSRYSPGEFYENMNCCALWDIFDDESVGDIYLDLLSDLSLSMIWTVSRDYRPDDIIDFWESWFTSYEFERQMKYIFRAHNMPFARPEKPVTPAPNSPPVADAGPDQTVDQVHAGGAQVYFDGSGSYDPDGDDLTYEWRNAEHVMSKNVTTSRTMPPGTTTITLAVSDGQEYGYDTVVITVVPTDPNTWITE